MGSGHMRLDAGNLLESLDGMLGMRTFDIEEARERLEDLVDEATAGDPFVITVDGAPLVTVIALDAEEIAGLCVEDEAPSGEG